MVTSQIEFRDDSYSPESQPEMSGSGPTGSCEAVLREEYVSKPDDPGAATTMNAPRSKSSGTRSREAETRQPAKGEGAGPLPTLILASKDNPGGSPKATSGSDGKAPVKDVPGGGAGTGDGGAKKPVPTDEDYSKDGKKVPIYTFRDQMAVKAKTYDPATGEIKEDFHEPFGIKDPTKSFGGVLLSTSTARTISRREEGQTADGKPVKTLEVTGMSGFHGYGSVGPITGDRKLDSVKMWQVNEGKDARGNDKVTSWKQPVTVEHALFGGKPYLKTQPAEPMTNEEFQMRWEETDPVLLQRFAKR